MRVPELNRSSSVSGPDGQLAIRLGDSFATDLVVEVQAPGRGTVRRRAWVSWGGEAQLGPVVMPVAGSVEGRVRGESEQDLSNQDLLLLPLNDPANRRHRFWDTVGWRNNARDGVRPVTITNPSHDGTYQFPDVSPGWYVVVTATNSGAMTGTPPFPVHPSQASHPPQVPGGLPGTTRDHVEPGPDVVDSHANDEHAPADSKTDVRSIRGRVIGPEGPLARAIVHAVITGLHPVATTRTHEDGRFEVEVEDPHAWAHDGFTPTRHFVADAPGLAPTPRFLPHEPALNGALRIELSTGGWLEGEVIGHDLSEGPVFVAAHHESGLRATIPVGRDGHYRSTNLTPGPWFVTLQPLGHDLYFSPMPWRNSTGILAEVRIENGVTHRVDLDLDRAPVVRGVVDMDRMNTRFPLLVSVLQGWKGPGSYLLEEVLVDLDGRFVIPELWDPDGLDGHSYGPVPQVSFSINPPLIENARWRLPFEWGSVTGTCARAPGSEVTFRRTESSRFFSTARVGRDGRFRFPSLPAGRGYMRVEGVGAVRIVVLANETVHATIE